MRTRSHRKDLLTRPSRALQVAYRLVDRLPGIDVPGRYNLTISHDCRFIWFRVAKVGTRTILGHLRASNCGLDVEHAYGLYYLPALYSDYYKFAFVRNPWDRLVSCWHSKVRRKNHFHLSASQYEAMQNFENFVAFVEQHDLTRCDHHIRLQSTLIDLNHIDYIGRLEQFADDMDTVSRHIGIESRELQSRNVSARRDYKYYYDAHLAERVERMYSRDIQLFGYTF